MPVVFAACASASPSTWQSCRIERAPVLVLLLFLSSTPSLPHPLSLPHHSRQNKQLLSLPADGGALLRGGAASGDGDRPRAHDHVYRWLHCSVHARFDDRSMRQALRLCRAAPRVGGTPQRGPLLRLTAAGATRVPGRVVREGCSRRAPRCSTGRGASRGCGSVAPPCRPRQGWSCSRGSGGRNVRVCTRTGGRHRRHAPHACARHTVDSGRDLAAGVRKVVSCPHLRPFCRWDAQHRCAVVLAHEGGVAGLYFGVWRVHLPGAPQKGGVEEPEPVAPAIKPGRGLQHNRPFATANDRPPQVWLSAAITGASGLPLARVAI